MTLSLSLALARLLLLAAAGADFSVEWQCILLFLFN
jgi:hypothetical protein